MDEVKEIMERYEQYNKDLRMQDLKNEKYNEEIEKAKMELNSPEDKAYNVAEVIKEYEKLKEDNAKETERIKQSIEAMKSDENKEIFTKRIEEVTTELETKKTELSKSKKDLLDFYKKDDKEGKIVEDFYREQREIESSIKTLENQKNQYEEFFENIKSNEQIIEEASQIMAQYENNSKKLKMAELKNEKYDEKIEEAKIELNSPEDKEYDVVEVIKEYEKLKEENTKEIQDIQASRNAMKSEKNIQTISNSIEKIQEEIEKKNVELSKSHEDLLAFYKKDNTEGKIVEDFYREQRKIEHSIKELQNKKGEYEEFLNKIRGKNTQTKPEGTKPEPAKPEGTKLEEPNVLRKTTEQIEMDKIQEEIKNSKLSKEDIKNIHLNDGVDQIKKIEYKVAKKEEQEIIENPIFTAIQISAEKEEVILKLEDGTDKIIKLDEIYSMKDEWKNNSGLRDLFNSYCKENKMGFIEKINMRRKINPIILKAINENGKPEEDIYNYMDVISGREFEKDNTGIYEIPQLPYPVNYDLINSKLSRKRFNELNKIAKREVKEIEGITAIGTEKNWFEKIVDKIKSTKLLSKGEEERKIPEENKEKTPEEKKDQQNFLRDNIIDEETKQKIQQVSKEFADMNKNIGNEAKNIHLEQDQVDLKSDNTER